MYKLLDSSNVPEDSFVSVSLEKGYDNDFIKIASERDFPAEVDEAIKNLVKKKDHSYVLVTAMGDGETWSSNKNGDYFPYDALLGLQNTPVWKEVAGKDERLDTKIKEKIRYKTFEDAHFFHHHKNKIDRGDPHFGYVPNSIWNPKMRTILLIIGVDRKKDPETAQMIDENKLLSVSMGAKLPWDRCSICGSKHKTILKYCPHLKYSMNQILQDGRKVYAENLFPRFFDISKVLKPAFIGGIQLEKIAYTINGISSIDLAEYYDIGQFDKVAETEKRSEIYKQIPCHVEATIAKTCNTEKDLPKAMLDDLSKLKTQQAWGALTHAGIIAKPNEFAYIILKHEGEEKLADQFYNAKVKLNRTDNIKGLDESLHHISTINIDHKAVKFADTIPDKILNERSIGFIGNRIYDTEKGLRKEAEVTRTLGLGAILSALYMLYRQNAESHFSAYGLLGSGISAMVRDDSKDPKFVGNNTYITDEMNKHANFLNSGKGLLLRGAAGFATPYILSAHYQNKMNYGEPVGIIGRTIANNPAKMGLVGAAISMAPGAAYDATKRITKDVLHIADKKK